MMWESLEDDERQKELCMKMKYKKKVGKYKKGISERRQINGVEEK